MWNAHLGDAQCRHAVPVAQTLIGDVVDGQDGRHAAALPAQIGRRQTAGPIIDVQHVRLPAMPARPAAISAAASDRRAKRRSLSGQSWPFRSGIRTSGALIERWLKNQIQDQPSAVRVSPMQQGAMPARPGRCATTVMSLALEITSG